MRQGLVALHSPRSVPPALGLHPRGITGPELAGEPMSHGSNPGRGCAGQNRSLIYCPKCGGAVPGMGERLMGGGGGRPTPLRAAVFAFLGRVPPEAESRRCAHAASDIIIILIMKGQLLQSSSPLRRREHRMQRRCVSLIPSSHRESAAMPGRSSARPLTQGDKNTCQVPPGCSPCCDFGCRGVPAWERGSPRCPPSSCPRHCPVQAPPSPRPMGKGRLGCRGESISCKGRALCPSFRDTARCARAFSFHGRNR